MFLRRSSFDCRSMCQSLNPNGSNGAIFGAFVGDVQETGRWHIHYPPPDNP